MAEAKDEGQFSSSSVVAAIEYCDTRLKLDQFKGSSATVKFIRMLDRLFDLLNSRNPCAKGYKSPLRIQNQTYWLLFFARKAICTTPRKTGNYNFKMT